MCPAGMLRVVCCNLDMKVLRDSHYCCTVQTCMLQLVRGVLGQGTEGAIVWV